jgi:hypothetical protein
MCGKKKQHINWNKIMSIRCKVCNASKITNPDQINPNINWECLTCGNLLDVNGYIVTSN